MNRYKNNLIITLLLIDEGGTLPFHIAQTDTKIDNILLSGFCMANYQIAKELHDEIDIILMKQKYKIIFSEFSHKNGKKYIMASICHKFHIVEGIKKKMAHIFDKHFKDYEFSNRGLVIKDEDIDYSIRKILNDIPLMSRINLKLQGIKELLDKVIKDQSNEIKAYALVSSVNNILLSNSTESFLLHHKERKLNEIIEDYLILWNVEKIPQADIFQGPELMAGLDLSDYVYTNTKTFGLCLNTSFNLTDDPSNELLLYIFGKNMLMRQCVMNVEEIIFQKLTLD